MALTGTVFDIGEDYIQITANTDDETLDRSQVDEILEMVWRQSHVEISATEMDQAWAKARAIFEKESGKGGYTWSAPSPVVALALQLVDASSGGRKILDERLRELRTYPLEQVGTWLNMLAGAARITSEQIGYALAERAYKVGVNSAHGLGRMAYNMGNPADPYADPTLGRVARDNGISSATAADAWLDGWQAAKAEQE